MNSRQARGFTVIELLIVCAIVSVLTAIAAPLYANILVHSRAVKAQSDIRSMASATQLYFSHMGRMPASLDVLATPSTNSNNRVGGPFLAALPLPPRGWSAYAYTLTAGGNFTISSSGEGVTVSGP